MGPPLTISSPTPDSDRANETSFAEWLDDDSLISVVTDKCPCPFHPSVGTWQHKTGFQYPVVVDLVVWPFLPVQNVSTLVLCYLLLRQRSYFLVGFLWWIFTSEIICYFVRTISSLFLNVKELCSLIILLTSCFNPVLVFIVFICRAMFVFTNLMWKTTEHSLF